MSRFAVSRSRRLLGPVVAACAIAAFVLLGDPPLRTDAQTPFASQIAALSEPPGYFDTDNLISNERSYLFVIPELRRANVRGGAYVGVGPDQNFSYIAEVRPQIAFIIDVRRDNLLLHLLFKAIFGLSRTRVEYLALLLARPVPEGLDKWRARSIDEVVAYLDSAAPPPARLFDSLHARVNSRIRGFGVPLSARDFETIDRFHRRFVADGLGLRFQSFGRPPQSNYPTYRQLLMETDPNGRQSNYLASEDSFQFVRSLQARDLVIPVVGDLTGPSAFDAVGRLVRERGERLSALYTSNVEFYLFSQGTFPRFIENLERMPRSDRSVIIRSVFNRGWGVPGYGSTSFTQPVADLLDGYSRGRFRSYRELTTSPVMR